MKQKRVTQAITIKRIINTNTHTKQIRIQIQINQLRNYGRWLHYIFTELNFFKSFETELKIFIKKKKKKKIIKIKDYGLNYGNSY